LFPAHHVKNAIGCPIFGASARYFYGKGEKNMHTVSFDVYQEAKNEILYGREFREDSIFPNQYGMSSKTYSTKDNGNFYEVFDPNTGILEFWSDKHSFSRYYDERTREEIISQYEAKLSALENDKEAALSKAEKENTRRYLVTEYKGRMFSIYKEDFDPYVNQKPIGEIELNEAVYVGGDLYIMPMQVYETENPALLKVVYLVGGLWFTERLNSHFADIAGNNIRTGCMTRDRKLYHHTGASDDDGICDLMPQPRRLEN
jgi:hypothetical protein